MNKPIVRVRLENNTFKVLEIKGNSGDILKSHKVDIDAILHLQFGSATYIEGKSKTILTPLSLQSIPPDQVHSIEFHQETQLLLILSKRAKIKFEKT